jgi:hypothetical protein
MLCEFFEFKHRIHDILTENVVDIPAKMSESSQRQQLKFLDQYSKYW